MNQNLRKIFAVCIIALMTFCVVACSPSGSQSQSQTQSNSSIETTDISSQTSESNSENSTTSNSSSSSSSLSISLKELTREAEISVSHDTSRATIQPNATPTIFLAGDSTVKTYEENQLIGGWGQFLSNFLKTEVKVSNKSNGGRSSRSFINEGSLFTDPDRNYGTSYTSIESEIKSGDYLMIQFGHNDDNSGGGFTNYLDRKVPVGTPDNNGIYPTVVPTKKVSTEVLPNDYVEYCKKNPNTQTLLTSGYGTISQFGKYYYSFDCGGTFKGYLKMYIDFARSKGAIPILCTPVTRVSFSGENTVVGAVNKHGANLEYVVAVRQLAEEEKCLLIDTYDYTKQFMEKIGKTQSDYLMALKLNSTTFSSGEWQTDFDTKYTAFKTSSDKMGITGIEGTHYNKYGAYITAAAVAESFLNLAETNAEPTSGEKINFAENVLATPSTKIKPSSFLTAKNLTDLQAVLQKVTI